MTPESEHKAKILQSAPLAKVLFSEPQDPVTHRAIYKSELGKIEQRIQEQIGIKDWQLLINSQSFALPPDIVSEDHESAHRMRANLVSQFICLGFELEAEENVKLFIPDIMAVMRNQVNRKYITERTARDLIGHHIFGLVLTGILIKKGGNLSVFADFISTLKF